MNKCWAWHGMAWSGKATGWKDYEFVWHCNIPIANETLVDAWALFAIFSIFFVWLQPILISLSLSVYWCRIANGVRMQFSGSPFEMKLNKNEKEEEEAEVTEEGKRRHNLSLVLWLVRMDEFFGAQVEYHVAVCAWFIALYDTKSRREIRKNIFNNRRRYAFACTRSSLAYTTEEKKPAKKQNSNRFGTGMSVRSCLKRYAVEYIKYEIQIVQVKRSERAQEKSKPRLQE